MSDDIDRIFDDCLDRLARDESVEGCLRLYPEQAAELEPLLRTAEATLQVARLVPDPVRKQAAKRRFLEVAQTQAPPKSKLIVLPRRIRAVAACLVAALLLVVAMLGALAVSADSSPGDRLYPAKRMAERTQLWFAWDDDDKAALHLLLAGRRLDELEAIANRRGVIRVSLVEEVMTETDDAASGLYRTDDKERLGRQLLELTSREQEVLNRIAAEAPEEAREELDKAIEWSKQGYSAASTAVAGSGQPTHLDDDREEQNTVTPSPTMIVSHPSPIATASRPSPTAKPDDGDDDDDEQKSGSPIPTATASRPSPTATAKPEDGDDEEKSSSPIPTATASRPSPTATQSRRQEEQRTPTALPGTPTPSSRDDDTKQPTATPATQATPAATATPRREEAWATPQPTATPTENEHPDDS